MTKLDQWIEDENGWSEWQLWELMEKLGNFNHIGMGGPIETEIEILEAGA